MDRHTTAPLTGPWHDAGRTPEERVDALLAVMTLEEKAGQLGSVWEQDRTGDAVGDVAPMEAAMAAGATFDEASEHGLGHLTRIFGTAPVTVAEGTARLRERQSRVVAASRFGIGAIAHEECLTGFTAYGATVYPTALAWGATFDPDLIETMAAAIGADMRAVGVHQGLSPVLDVVRDYRWGRTEESIGEDPYLVATVGTAYVRGLQSAGVLAALKHFAGYSASRAGRNHAPVSIGPRELADVILPPFEMAVRAGAASVMNSYSDLDGVPPAASRGLLTELLRGRWGFTGTVVSDYWAVNFLELMHHVAADQADAGRLAISAGLDVELPETGGFRHLPDLVRAGALDEQVLDTAARRVLLQKVAIGLLDPPSAGVDHAGVDHPGHEGAAATGPDAVEPARDLDSPANRALAARIAERSVVLLRNEGVLPLATTGRVAVLGSTATSPRTLMGCYSFPNHVMSRYAEHGTGIEVPTVLEALRTELPGAVVVHERGAAIMGQDRSGIPAAAALAASADVAVVTVGDLAGLFGRGTSGEGCDAEDLTLPGVQAELVEAVLATGTPVVLVVVSGRPYALGAFAERCAAIVQAFFPGEEGATAIAGVLAGRVNPGGRLPVGVPRHPGGQPATYLSAPLGRHSEGISNLDPTPLYPFGHGLSYHRCEYSDLTLTAGAGGTGIGTGTGTGTGTSSDASSGAARAVRIAPDGEVAVALTVRNTGERAGAEVVQLYLSDHAAQVVRPVRELVGFARVELDAGEARRVTFTLHADRTSFTGADLRRVVEPGVFTLAAGRSSEDLPLSAELEIVGDTRTLDGPRVMTTPVRSERV